MEIENHIQHLAVTYDKLLTIFFPDEELDRVLLQLKNRPTEPIERTSWIKTSSLALEGVTTEKMALIHLLWFQNIGRLKVEDIDPFAGAVRIKFILPKPKIKEPTPTKS